MQPGCNRWYCRLYYRYRLVLCDTYFANSILSVCRVLVCDLLWTYLRNLIGIYFFTGNYPSIYYCVTRLLYRTFYGLNIQWRDRKLVHGLASWSAWKANDIVGPIEMGKIELCISFSVNNTQLHLADIYIQSSLNFINLLSPQKKSDFTFFYTWTSINSDNDERLTRSFNRFVHYNPTITIHNTQKLFEYGSSFKRYNDKLYYDHRQVKVNIFFWTVHNWTG